MDTSQTLKQLQEFTTLITTAEITTKAQYIPWAKKNSATMAELFGYKQEKGMPNISALAGAFFHPTLPLIGFNYTPVAHNTLHEYPQGWTPVLRRCRGTIFDRAGNLIALPFPKFLYRKTWPYPRSARTSKSN